MKLKKSQRANDGRYHGVHVLMHCIWRGQSLIVTWGDQSSEPLHPSPFHETYYYWGNISKKFIYTTNFACMHRSFVCTSSVKIFHLLLNLNVHSDEIETVQCIQRRPSFLYWAVFFYSMYFFINFVWYKLRNFE